jgi:arginine exporter protein ArgO
MRSRLIIEIVIIISVIGLITESAGGRTWFFIGALLAAVIWLLYRSSQSIGPW